MKHSFIQHRGAKPFIHIKVKSMKLLKWWSRIWGFNLQGYAISLAQEEHRLCLLQNVQSPSPAPAICFALLSNKRPWGKCVYNSRYRGWNPVARHMGVHASCWFQENVKPVQPANVPHDELRSCWLGKNSRPHKVPWVWYSQLFSSQTN